MDYNLNQLKKLGFKIKEGKHLRKINNYFAGTDKERASDFMNMFKDPEVAAIMCYRGGYGSIRMMPYINWDVIKNNPKIFCGFSDITLLLNYINKVSNIPTFHTPMVNSNLQDFVTQDFFLNLLTKKYSSINLKNFKNIKTFNSKNIIGKICGGNLSMICSALGTPYDIDTNNKILLLEDINEPAYKIDRMLTQLLMSKKLDKCCGFILGHFTPYDINTLNLIKNILLPLNKPIILGFPSGHAYPNVSLPLGSNILIDFSQNIISIEPIFK